MGKYLKDELFISRFAPMFVKILLSCGAVYYISKTSANVGMPVDMNFLATGILIFLTMYMLCSIFHINFKLTGNYIIGFFTGCASVGFSLYIMSTAGNLVGTIMLIGLFLGFLVYDIYKIIQILRINVD